MPDIPPIGSESANGSPHVNLKPATAKQGMSRLTVAALGCWICFLILLAFGFAGMYLMYQSLENWNPG
jgi:type VI protein secretion system component VasF